MGKRVAILQSNYIPWKGYFDLIHRVDEFILFDDMQYTRRDWRNRNKIKTPQGLLWVTIPVEVKGKYFQKIKDTIVSDLEWPRIHWKTIHTFYARAPHFFRYADRFEKIYGSLCNPQLSHINYLFIKEICTILDIKTKITWSMDYGVIDGKTERLVDLCKKAGATEYLSGPAAKDYIIESQFTNAGIELQWMSYDGYKEYQQLHPPFEHGVTILDLLFNAGPDASKFMLSF